MKTQTDRFVTPWFVAYALAALTVAFVPACTSIQQDAGAKIIARRATIEVLKARPAARPAFVATTTALDLLLKNTAASRADFVKAIQGLSIRELKGQQGAAALADVIDLLDVAIASKPWIGDGLPRLRSLLLAVNDGVLDGLAFTVIPQ